jgi:geranylgeranyl pyrophosphate synthase
VESLAAAVETLHAATLVHDDFVDQSLVRRGMPTLNARWNAGATVLAGDWLFARAARFAAAASSVRVMEIFARTLGTMTAGELRQLFGRAGVPTREEYEFRIYAKTASLFEAATEAAGVLALGEEADVAALARYGRDLGMAFQIVDDILDFTGDAERLGKPVGSDLRAGTVTLPVLLHLEANPVAARWLTDGAADGAVEELIQAVRADERALAGARREAIGRRDAAVAALDAIPRGGARDELARIAEYAVARDF